MPNKKVIDLTHTLNSEIPSWDGSCWFTLETTLDYKDCTEPNIFRGQKMDCRMGAGTHMDAPAHCFPGGKTIEQLSLENLTTECVVIKTDHAGNENYLVMPESVTLFEREYGTIPENAFVIFHTGWDAHWNSPEKYRNDLAFPSIHESTAKLLLERNIAGIGIDTLSPDAGGKNFPVHRAILGAGKYIVENVANAKELTATGAKIIIAPLKIQEGTESPIRLMAFI